MYTEFYGHKRHSGFSGSMSCLLASLGVSPWILAEAFLTANAPYDRVRIITSSSSNVDLHTVHRIFKEIGFADYDILPVAGLTALQDQVEQNAFEDRLYSWYLETLASAMEVEVCISGGFKSMAASLQKAAHLLGARDVFHVLADGNPDCMEAVRKAIQNGSVRRISMGPEPGWPTLRRWGRLQGNTIGGGVRTAIQQQLKQMRRTQASAPLVSGASALPFPDLSLLSPDILAWLSHPMEGENDRAWIHALPKVELHCHLGGFATGGPLLKQVRAAAKYPEKLPPFEEPVLPKEWPWARDPLPLGDYMALGDANGSTLLKDPGCLSEQVCLLYQHLKEEKIHYAEIRCSPNNYATDECGALDVLELIQAAFESCEQSAIEHGELAPRVNLLVIVTRRQSGDLSGIARHLSLAVTASARKRRCRVVGVDLAGFEEERTRPVYFQTDFNIAHRCGLAVTAHAGENDDVESIWQAVYKLSARRIGHALHLLDSPDLLRVVRDRAIGIEMCPFANFQIHGFGPMKNQPVYPFLNYLRAGLKVTVNTDNPGISAAGLGENMAFLSSLCPGFTRMDLLHCIRNAIDVAFIEPSEQDQLMEDISQHAFYACQTFAGTI